MVVSSHTDKIHLVESNAMHELEFDASLTGSYYEFKESFDKIETDYKNQWKKHWLLKHFLELYEKRIFSHEFHKREKELWREAYRLQGVIKKYLDLKIFVPTPEPFHAPIYGYSDG